MVKVFFVENFCCIIFTSELSTCSIIVKCSMSFHIVVHNSKQYLQVKIKKKKRKYYFDITIHLSEKCYDSENTQISSFLMLVNLSRMRCIWNYSTRFLLPHLSVSMSVSISLSVSFCSIIQRFINLWIENYGICCHI